MLTVKPGLDCTLLGGSNHITSPAGFSKPRTWFLDKFPLVGAPNSAPKPPLRCSKWLARNRRSNQLSPTVEGGSAGCIIPSRFFSDGGKIFKRNKAWKLSTARITPPLRVLSHSLSSVISTENYHCE